MKNFRFIVGVTFWTLVVGAFLLTPLLFSENNWVRSIRKITGYVTADRQMVQVNFDRDLYVRMGDPVYMKTEYGWKRIGQVISDQLNESGQRVRKESVTLVLFGDAPPITNNCYVTLHETPSSFEWAFRKLLPDEKRKEILNRLRSKFAEHQQEIVGGFAPIIRNTVFEIGFVLQEDLRAALKENRERLAQIGARYQESFVEKRLIPLIKQEIWPIVEERSQPLLDEVGSEIWKRASLWRFGWRLAYDKFPLTNSNLLQQEWNRFVKNDAVPVIESYADDFYQLARSIMREIAENKEVKLAGKEGLQQLLNDEEIKNLISETLWKILFENERLKEVIRRNLSDKETVRQIRQTSEKFEDKIREIGDEIFGTFERGITKEFAGVLRKEILRRDQRWFVLRYKIPSGDDPLELATQIDGQFRMDYSDRPEFVRYRNDK